MIAKIENGQKVNIEPDLALRLADAFSFNLMECERLLKATVLSQLPKLGSEMAHECAYNIQPPQHYLETAWQTFTSEYAPAILHDELYDLIGVNRPVMAFHGVDEATLLQMRETPGANFLHFVFHPNSPLFANNPAAWEQFALNNLYQFRYFCLLLHFTKRCQEIFAYLDTLPRFRPLWNQALLEPKVPSVYQKPYIYRHAAWGFVRYSVDTLPMHTPYGYLYVAKISAQDNATEEIIVRMREQGHSGVLRLMSWIQMQGEAVTPIASAVL